MTTTTPPGTASRRRALRAWLLWTAGFLAFPVAGIAGIAVAGRVDRPAAAVLGGLASGAVLGLGQALLSSGRLPMLRWTVATALGMSAGLLHGAQTVGYGTTLAQIAVMGALTGAVLGAAQALALPHRARSRWVWAVAMPVLWPTGWAVTTSIGIPVEEQLTLFGASGAVTVSALLGILLHTLLPPSTTLPNTTPTSQVPPSPEPTHTTTTGDLS